MLPIKLAAWYAEHGRSLPWRDLADIGSGGDLTVDDVAYRVWLSEIILQQTTVRQGTDYYLRFIERWPHIHSLAAATEDEILREWQGLGYYTRARNLHAAARQVVELGAFPSTYKEILKLKGVGPYTAAAIASIVFGEPRAVVDGNVYRVLSRYFAIDTPIDTPAGQRDFAALADAILDKRHPGHHNQAIMDFGALQCTPHSPHCHDCPLADSCLALQQGRVADLPVKARRTKVEEVAISYCLVCSESGLFLRQRAAKGIWAKLWEVVVIDDNDNDNGGDGGGDGGGDNDNGGDNGGDNDNDGASPCASPFSAMSQPVKFLAPQPLGTFRHVLTHRRITCRATALPITSEAHLSALRTLLAPSGYQFISWAELEHYALPRLIENIITQYRGNVKCKV